MDHWNPSGGEGFEADVAPELLFKDVQTCSRAGPLGAAAFLPAVPCQGTEAPTELCTPCLRRAPAMWLLLSGLSRLEAVGHLRVLEGLVGSGAGLELLKGRGAHNGKNQQKFCLPKKKPNSTPLGKLFFLSGKQLIFLS
ncbi:hypothetical protein EK904_012772 [Melospiza melodia maxima]|nr:hypothetical protein EK904_012772 [Melospiza melodia maxima]